MLHPAQNNCQVIVYCVFMQGELLRTGLDSVRHGLSLSL